MAIKLANLAALEPTSTDIFSKGLEATTIPKKIHSLEQSRELMKAGFVPVISSWVSALGVEGNDLYIRFHNGNVYKYQGLGSKYQQLAKAQSKGRAIHKFIFGKVKGKKVGSLPISGDVEVMEDIDTQDVQQLHNQQLFRSNAAQLTGDTAYDIKKLEITRELLPAPVEGLREVVPITTITLPTPISPIISIVLPNIATGLLITNLLAPVMIPSLLFGPEIQ